MVLLLSPALSISQYLLLTQSLQLSPETALQTEDGTCHAYCVNVDARILRKFKYTWTKFVMKITQNFY